MVWGRAWPASPGRVWTCGLRTNAGMVKCEPLGSQILKTWRSPWPYPSPQAQITLFQGRTPGHISRPFCRKIRVRTITGRVPLSVRTTQQPTPGPGKACTKETRSPFRPTECLPNLFDPKYSFPGTPNGGIYSGRQHPHL